LIKCTLYNFEMSETGDQFDDIFPRISDDQKDDVFELAVSRGLDPDALAISAEVTRALNELQLEEEAASGSPATYRVDDCGTNNAWKIFDALFDLERENTGVSTGENYYSRVSKDPGWDVFLNNNRELVDQILDLISFIRMIEPMRRLSIEAVRINRGFGLSKLEESIDPEHGIDRAYYIVFSRFRPLIARALVKMEECGVVNPKQYDYGVQD